MFTTQFHKFTISQIYKLSQADDPFVAEELAISMAKALAASGASPEDIVKALQESLKATGASNEEMARVLFTAMATSGVNPDDIAQTMQTLMAESGKDNQISGCRFKLLYS